MKKRALEDSDIGQSNRNATDLSNSVAKGLRTVAFGDIASTAELSQTQKRRAVAWLRSQRVTDIARAEGVSRQAVSESLRHPRVAALLDEILEAVYGPWTVPSGWRQETMQRLIREHGLEP